MPETPATDTAYALMLQVAEFLKKLPADEYGALLSGESRLAVIPKGARVTGPTTRKVAAPVAVDSERIKADLAAFTSVADANRYLADLKLANAALVALADQLGARVTKSWTAARLRNAIIEHTVAYRLDREALR